jgi:type VI secretion system protein VasJ
VELEASLAKAPFWFDGQRLVWECLQNLNAEMACAKWRSTSRCCNACPASSSSFHDGTPFADPPPAPGSPQGHAAPANRQRPPVAEPGVRQPAWEKALEASLPILRKDGLKPPCRFSSSRCKRPRRARAVLLAVRPRAAVLHGQEIRTGQDPARNPRSTLQDSGLHAWEPDLALEVLHLLHTCCELLPQNHVVRERKEEIYRRLCHLDLEVVLE